MTMFHRGKTRLVTTNRVLDRLERDMRASAPSWYSIRNAKGAEGDTAELHIYDEIGFWGVTAAQFARDLGEITAPQLRMRVSSPGGDVFDGIAIYNMIRSHPAYTTAVVEGLAASIASVIVQAADRRVMMPHAQMMIHDAWGMVAGNAADLREFADMLDKQSGIIADVYLDRIRGGERMKAKIRAMMAAETWLVDQEAVTAGLADAVESPSWKAGPSEADPEDDPDDDPTPDDPAPDDEAGDPAATVDDASVDDAWATIRRQWEADQEALTP